MINNEANIVLGFISIPLYILLYLWWAYVATVIWMWFAVSQFNLPAISVTQAIGIGLIVSLFLSGTANRGHVAKLRTDKDSSAIFIEEMVEAFLRPALILLVGWIVRQFM